MGRYALRIIIKFVLKNIWEKKLRTLLILVSVMLSSALYFATEALSDTAADMFIERRRAYFGAADLMIYPTQESPSSFFYRNRAEQFMDDLEYIAGAIETSGTPRHSWHRPFFWPLSSPWSVRCFQS